ncbi:hypothetical protein F5880DRAFT_228792 [Lentinula raphanica]|nr:hypothetical protein F5880DRAFT_228792 [Lentinula raphanica]
MNAFGIPQATMRCLELAQSIAQMGDLMLFSIREDLGPVEALSKMAAEIRERERESMALNHMHTQPVNEIDGMDGHGSSGSSGLSGSHPSSLSSAPPRPRPAGSSGSESGMAGHWNQTQDQDQNTNAHSTSPSSGNSIHSWFTNHDDI